MEEEEQVEVEESRTLKCDPHRLESALTKFSLRVATSERECECREKVKADYLISDRVSSHALCNTSDDVKFAPLPHSAT